MKNVIKKIGVVLVGLVVAYVVSTQVAEAKWALHAPTWKTHSVVGSTINLSWNNVAGSGNFTVYYKSSTSRTYSSTRVYRNSVSFTGTLGSTYNFYLVANPLHSSQTKSSPSSIKTVMIPNRTVKLQAPTTVSLYAGYKQISVWFSVVSNSKVYAIQYRLKGTSYWSTVYVTPKSAWTGFSSYTLTGLKNKMTYEIRVSARATKGSGFTHSNYTSSMSKKTNSGTSYRSSKTFVDYNLQRDSYSINW